jgi:hypothetical protein
METEAAFCQQWRGFSGTPRSAQMSDVGYLSGIAIDRDPIIKL